MLCCVEINRKKNIFFILLNFCFSIFLFCAPRADRCKRVLLADTPTYFTWLATIIILLLGKSEAAAPAAVLDDESVVSSQPCWGCFVAWERLFLAIKSNCLCLLLWSFLIWSFNAALAAAVQLCAILTLRCSSTVLSSYLLVFIFSDLLLASLLLLLGFMFCCASFSLFVV